MAALFLAGGKLKKLSRFRNTSVPFCGTDAAFLTKEEWPQLLVVCSNEGYIKEARKPSSWMVHYHYNYKVIQEERESPDDDMELLSITLLLPVKTLSDRDKEVAVPITSRRRLVLVE